MRFPSKITSSYIWVAIPIDWVILHWFACGADGQSGGRACGRTVTWLPKFLGWVDYFILKVKNDHRSKFSNLIGKKKPEKKKKIRASMGFEPVTSALPVRCSTNWAMKPHIGSEVNLLSSYLPWGVKWCEVYENNSYLNCGCRWMWRMIIAVNFPI